MAALLLLLAPLFDGIVAGFERASRPLRSAAMRLAVIELRTPATRTRSLAIAATGAVAVFGSVAIGGAHSNLQSGLDRTATDMNRVSDVGLGGGEREHARDDAVRDELRGTPGIAARGALAGHLPRRVPRRRGPADMGDRAAEQLTRADPRQPAA